MALPNLIIAGAPKCGTTSLFRWIDEHPEAEGSSVKETCFFVDPQSHVFDPSSNFASGGLAVRRLLHFSRCTPRPSLTGRSTGSG